MPQQHHLQGCQCFIAIPTDLRASWFLSIGTDVYLYSLISPINWRNPTGNFLVL